MERRKPIETAPSLFGGEVPVGKVRVKAHKYEKEKDPDENPMVREYGQHIDPLLRCKDCDKLLVNENISKNTYWCSLRTKEPHTTHTHHKHWMACTKFEVYDKNHPHEIIK